MKYGRILNNLVQEVFVCPEGFTIGECFHPDVVKLFSIVPDEVEAMWIKTEDGTFMPPRQPITEIPVTKVE